MTVKKIKDRLFPDKATFIQLFRYGLIGLTRTGLGYLVYLSLTHHGTDPKNAMSMLFVVGVIISFTLNRRWTFAHTGSITASALRFGTVYLIGYLINLGMLYLFVDIHGLPHQWVQLSAILILIVYFFTALKLFVFKGST